MEAFDEVNAHNIYVFPNNSNIILAANQAKEMYDKSNIYVVDTKNVGEAYAALSMLDYSLENPDDLYNLFVENCSSENVGTALVCKATRDVKLCGVKVKENDYIVIKDKEIVIANVSIVDAVVEFFKMNDFMDLATIFYGKNVTGETKKEISEKVREQMPDIELYEADGGQDTFDLIIIIE